MRDQKRKHFDREKSLHFKAVNPETIVFQKNATLEELDDIREKVQEKNKRYWRLNIIYIALIMISLVFLSFYIISLLYD